MHHPVALWKVKAMTNKKRRREKWIFFQNYLLIFMKSKNSIRYYRGVLAFNCQKNQSFSSKRINCEKNFLLRAVLYSFFDDNRTESLSHYSSGKFSKSGTMKGYNCEDQNLLQMELSGFWIVKYFYLRVLFYMTS